MEVSDIQVHRVMPVVKGEEAYKFKFEYSHFGVFNKYYVKIGIHAL